MANLPAKPVCSHSRESNLKLPLSPSLASTISSPTAQTSDHQSSSSLVPPILTGSAPHATAGILGTPNLGHVPPLLYTLPWRHLTYSQGPSRCPTGSLWSVPITSLPSSARTVPATMGFLLQTKHAPASGSSQLLFPLPGVFSIRYRTVLATI